MHIIAALTDATGTVRTVFLGVDRRLHVSRDRHQVVLSARSPAGLCLTYECGRFGVTRA
jgi:hypothetical protein